MRNGHGQHNQRQPPRWRDHILTALRYWVVEMHVDGFRFDLASVLGRDVKLIAEAWDVAAAYGVGSFSKRRCAKERPIQDDVRRFWRGDSGMLGLFASRICGSADIYTRSGKGLEGSINFITCHDGFTLNDLVSYRFKHNEANGESNHDGTSANFSENCGAEGKTADTGIEDFGNVRSRTFF